MRFDQAPASDPHGRRPAAGPRRQQPAARPGAAQRTGPGQRPRRPGPPGARTPDRGPAAAGGSPGKLANTGNTSGDPASGPASGEATRAEIGTTWRTAGPAPGGTTRAAGHPAALLFAGDQHDQGGHDHPGGDPHGRQPTTTTTGSPAAIRKGGGQERRSEQDQGTGPRAKKETARTGTATRATTTTKTTRSPGRRIEARHLPEDHPARTRRTPATHPAIRHQDRNQVERPPARDRHHLAGSRPGARWCHPGRGSPGRRHDQGAHDHTDGHNHPGGDPHGRRPAAGARRRRPAPGPGTARRIGPGHRATGKEENHRDGRSDHSDPGGQKPGRRIEARHLPEDHPARTRRTPATPPAIRHQAKQPGPRSARPGGQQARRQVDPPRPRITRPALLFEGDQPNQGANERTDGHDHPGSNPHGRQPTGAHRRRPAAGPGTAQRTEPGHRATDKEENHQGHHSGHGDHGHQEPGSRIEARPSYMDTPSKKGFFGSKGTIGAQDKKSHSAKSC